MVRVAGDASPGRLRTRRKLHRLPVNSQRLSVVPTQVVVRPRLVPPGMLYCKSFLKQFFSWTKRIQNSIKNSFLGTPRFHRRKSSNTSLIDGCDIGDGSGYMSNSTSTDSEKKSWFKDVWNSVNQDQNYSIIIHEQHHQKVKNQLIQVVSAPIFHFKKNPSDFSFHTRSDARVPTSKYNRNIISRKVLVNAI